MSRPRSRSPRYRRFPWEEPGFDPHKLVSELDGSPEDRGHRLRDGPEEPRRYFREDMRHEGRGRSPHFFPDGRHFGHQRHTDQEEFYHRRASPHHDTMRYEDQRLSPLHDGRAEGDRRKGGFREHFQSFDNRGGSPPRLMRERLPPTPRSHSDHQHKEPEMAWRREEQGRGRGRFRDASPSTGLDDQRAGADRERGRRGPQGPHRGRKTPHHERSLAFKRQRREMDDADHLGYRDEEDFGEQGYSVDPPRDGFRGDSRGNARHSAPLVIEHDHGIPGTRHPPRREQFNDRRDVYPGFDRPRNPRPAGSSQERFRMPDGRLDDREDTREHHFQSNLKESNYHEPRRSPVPQDRPNTMRYGTRAGPVNHRGRGSAHPAKRRFDPSQAGRTGPPRSQTHLQQSPQGYQDHPHEEQRPGNRPFREDYDNPIEEEPKWAEEDQRQQWEPDRPASLGRHLPRDDLDPKMPRQRERGWSDQKTKSMTVVTEETLTIKVDMSRPANQNR